MRKFATVHFYHLFGCMTLGVLFSLGASQILWLASAKKRIDSYANVILIHAENIAGNITAALDEMNSSSFQACEPSDLVSLKKITYQYRFIKDAGRIEKDTINCSAMWGVIPAFRLLGDSRVTKNNVTLWGNIQSYFPSAIKIDVSAKGNSFVVTSPTAFAPFDSPPTELSSSVTSRDGKTIMRTFGEPQKGNILTSTHARACSEKYDICVNANIQANICLTQSIGLFFFIVTAGCIVGLLVFYAISQYREVIESLSHRLRSAIADESISTAYQPIVQGATGEVSGFEVLARWNDKKLGSIPPNIFIKKAESLGLQKALNELIINKALNDCSTWLKCNPEAYLSFNIETKDLLDGEFMRYMSLVARSHGISSNQIAIEILEGATAEISHIEDKIKSLRSLGHKVLIDDFGSGYSSLSYLAKLNVDVIKIDRSFTQAAGTDSPAAIVLGKIYEIAKALNSKIVFEGVETEVQKTAILGFCPDALMQGWLFSKALTISELVEVARTQSTQGKVMFFSSEET